ncbi:MAG: 4Fe-4S binding protein [Flavobacteriales bacterium]|nr:4Fe-4S binding protein [Flavobacteriales bacterium]
MKIIQKIGILVFVSAMLIFIASTFMGSFELTQDSISVSLNEKQKKHIQEDLNGLSGTYTTPIAITSKIKTIYDQKNEDLRKQEQWGEVMYESGEELSLRVLRMSATGPFKEKKGLMLFLTFGLAIIGSLLFILPQFKLLGPPGIKHHGIYHDAITNKGWVAWIAFSFLVIFYILLYFYPSNLINQIMMLDVCKQWLGGEQASQWFLYGVLYCVAMTLMAIRMFVKYRHNNYQMVRTASVLFFQLIFAFLLVEILPLFNLPAVDLKNAWPLDYDFLFDWNVKNLFAMGNAGKFFFFWGIILSIVVVPTMTYFFGKRWYCSWVCGCGGLAETLGDPFRQHSDKSLKAWKFERYIIHAVLLFAVIMTTWTGMHTYSEISGTAKSSFLGLSVFDIRQWYGFLIGSIFSGVIGTGFYPIFGNRVWCRFGCPLAAFMGIVQRFKSRFRITTNGGQCISCGNCSTYCEQGIDVRSYAQKGQNIVRASCVGCGVCAAVCPRGVLKLENGPEEKRINDNPIIIGNDGIKLNV